MAISVMSNISKAVLLAAGRGTRMRELTAELPKPMIASVQGIPVLKLAAGNDSAVSAGVAIERERRLEISVGLLSGKNFWKAEFQTPRSWFAGMALMFLQSSRPRAFFAIGGKYRKMRKSFYFLGV